MKLIVSKSNLLNGVQTVSKAVPNKTTMSILECILVDARGTDIKLIANDMELGIETLIEGKIEEKSFRIMKLPSLPMIILKLRLPVKNQNLILLASQGKIFLICLLLKRLTLLLFPSLL